MMLLGGSKTSAAPADERAGGKILPRYEQTLDSMRWVELDCGLFVCLSERLTEKLPWQLAWA
jgi:hypothetical protein